jgi:hypothetical protein
VRAVPEPAAVALPRDERDEGEKPNRTLRIAAQELIAGKCGLPVPFQ